MNAMTDIQTQGLTRSTRHAGAGAAPAGIPEDVRAWARHCVLDYLACTVAGAQEDLTHILLDEFSEQGGAPTPA